MKVNVDQLLHFEDLASLGEAVLRGMAPLLRLDRFRRGSQICSQGDDGDRCWFLLEGEITVTRLLPDGRRIKLATLGAGTIFGQSALVDGQPRTADVKAETDVVLATLTQRTLLWALGQGQEWAVAVQAIVAIQLVRQLRSALTRLEGLAASDDAGEAAEGRSRAEIKRSIDVDFRQGLKEKKAREAAERRSQGSFKAAPATPPAPAGPPSPAAAASPGAWDEAYEPLPPVEARPASATSTLLEMMALTEASLAGQGFDLDNVDFVYDEDQQRTADARRV